MDSGRPALLFFDEAHLLKPPVLEELRLFSNLIRNGKNLLQVVLVGQPELEKRVKRNRSLCQRIGVRYRLGPLSRAETSQYISHRLGAAGNEQPSEIFSEEAIDAVYRLSGGFPRQINVIAGYSMLSCFAQDGSRVNAGHVESVKAEYGFEDVTPGTKGTERLDRVETTKESTTVAVEQTLPDTTEDDGEHIAPEQEYPESRMEPSGFSSPTFSIDSPETRWLALSLLLLASLFLAWILMTNRSPAPASKVDRTEAPKPVPPDLRTASPSQEPATRKNPLVEQGSEEHTTDLLQDRHIAKSSVGPGGDKGRVAERKTLQRGEPSLVIKRDRQLADGFGQPVTVQIASILDSQLANDSLERASSKTGIPGAIETVPAGETTWYLVLLGCFDSAQEAEGAVDSAQEPLRDMGVTEIRIKPAPRWLRDVVAEREISPTNLQ
jgi:hypothetical protein